MNHKKVSVVLIAAGAVACLGILWVFGIYLPILARICHISFPKLEWLYWPALVYGWCIGLIYLAALAGYLSICRRIGQNRSFCRENVSALRRISILLFATAAMWLLSLASSWLPDMGAGPWCMVPLLLAMASGAMGLLAWALSWLLGRAMQLQEENDLTI